MKLHANAPLSPKGRQLLIDRIERKSQKVRDAAESLGVSERTARKWLARYRVEGAAGLIDRPSAPNVVANRTDEQPIEVIAALRRLRFTGPEIAEVLDRPVSTLSGILTRIGMGKLGRLGLEPTERYERQVAGELIHVDVKKLGRIVRGAGKRIMGGSSHYTGSFTDRAGTRRRKAGWEYVHIAIDDATRLAYAEVLSDEKATTAIGFLRRAIAFFESHGMTVFELLTDNGSAYRSRLFAKTCQALGIKHCFTKPYHPQTNGKAERFIQTCLREWAYGRTWQHSTERTAWLPSFLTYYNTRRPHSALAGC